MGKSKGKKSAMSVDYSDGEATLKRTMTDAIANKTAKTSAIKGDLKVNVESTNMQTRGSGGVLLPTKFVAPVKIAALKIAKAIAKGKKLAEMIEEELEERLQVRRSPFFNEFEPRKPRSFNVFNVSKH